MWEDYSFPHASLNDDPQCRSPSTADREMSDSFDCSDFSGAASPLSEEDPIERSSCSITNLSQQFQLHSLETRAQPVYPHSPPPIASSHIALSLRDSTTDTNQFDRRRQQRQYFVRRQCSSKDLARLAALIENTETSDQCPSNIGPQDGDGLPPIQIHSKTTPSSDQEPPTDPKAYDLDLRKYTNNGNQTKIGKQLAHRISREGLARQRLVHRDVRLRTRRQSTTSSRKY